MKEKILPFIIGLLVGAIIATGCFYLYSKTVEATIPASEFNGRPGMGGQNGEMREFKKREMQNQTTDDDANADENRPELPDGEMPDGEPPAKPEENVNTEVTNNETSIN